MGRGSAAFVVAVMLAAASLVVVGEVGHAKRAAALSSNPSTRTSDRRASGRLLTGRPGNGQAPPATLGYLPGDPANYGAAKSALVQGNSVRHRSTTTSPPTTTSTTSPPTTTSATSTTSPPPT